MRRKRREVERAHGRMHSTIQRAKQTASRGWVAGQRARLPCAEAARAGHATPTPCAVARVLGCTSQQPQPAAPRFLPSRWPTAWCELAPCTTTHLPASLACDSTDFTLRRYCPTLMCFVGWPNLLVQIRCAAQQTQVSQRSVKPSAGRLLACLFGCQGASIAATRGRTLCAVPVPACKGQPLSPSPMKHSPCIQRAPAEAASTPAEAASSAPVKVVHELVAQEGLAAGGQAHQDHNQLLPVHALLAPGAAPHCVRAHGTHQAGRQAGSLRVGA